MWKGAVVLCGHIGIVLTRFQPQTLVRRRGRESSLPEFKGIRYGIGILVRSYENIGLLPCVPQDTKMSCKDLNCFRSGLG